jgi:hypothetical protein
MNNPIIAQGFNGWTTGAIVVAVIILIGALNIIFSLWEEGDK